MDQFSSSNISDTLLYISNNYERLLSESNTASFLKYMVSLPRRMAHTTDVIFSSSFLHFVLFAGGFFFFNIFFVKFLYFYTCIYVINYMLYVLTLLSDTVEEEILSNFQILSILYLFPLASIGMYF